MDKRLLQIGLLKLHRRTAWSVTDPASVTSRAVVAISAAGTRSGWISDKLAW